MDFIVRGCENIIKTIFKPKDKDIDYLIKNKIPVDVQLIDRLYTFGYDFEINKDIPIELISSKKIQNMLYEFKKLVEEQYGDDLFWVNDFSDYKKICFKTGIREGKKFTYRIVNSKLIIYNMYDNYILLRTIKDKMAYTIMKSDFNNMIIKYNEVA